MKAAQCSILSADQLAKQEVQLDFVAAIYGRTKKIGSNGSQQLLQMQSGEDASDGLDRPRKRRTGWIG